jgi:hypothetical protein
MGNAYANMWKVHIPWDGFSSRHREERRIPMEIGSLEYVVIDVEDSHIWQKW